ncbi:MAG: thiamine-phosphate kinase [Verrucomicrobiales bacterium]|jgi:thiamine-monophosphate kinase|nr:thiamine-phosphate kinase [Verrucomicrobiales bacterium]
MVTAHCTEDDWVRRWLARWPVPRNLTVGAGDDCAVLPAPDAGYDLVLKTDAIVQDVHFTLADPPRRIGAKAVNRVLSDFAAMGAEPLTLTVSVGLPRHQDPALVAQCYAGMARAAAPYRVSLAGGETTRAAELWFSVSGLGRVPRGRAVRRATAAPGDRLLVTGTLGGAPRNGKHLTFTPRLAEGRWLAEHRFATAMLDLSDGLGKDLPRLAAASRLGFTLDAAALPLTRGCDPAAAVNDGEDYELLFTVRPRRLPALLRTWPFATQLTPIGRLTRPGDVNTDGLIFRGYDHFD